MYIRFNAIMRFLLTLANKISTTNFRKEQKKLELDEIKRFNNSII